MEADEKGRIHRLDVADVNRICSGQVVTVLATAVKELLENALDAKATSVDIKLVEYGAEVIEVSDNGHGIRPDQFAHVALKSYTSKITSFEDVYAASSFGFRGEALAALCELSTSVTVTTRTAAEKVGAEIAYGHDGRVLSQRPVARAVGTTVRVCGLFSRFPVRHREFLRSVRTQYTKLSTVLQGYGLQCAGKRVHVTNTVTGSSAQMLTGHSALPGLTAASAGAAASSFSSSSSAAAARAGTGGGTGKSEVLLAVSGGRTLADCIVDVLGRKALESLQPITVPLELTAVVAASAVDASDGDTGSGGDGGGDGDASTSSSSSSQAFGSLSSSSMSGASLFGGAAAEQAPAFASSQVLDARAITCTQSGPLAGGAGGDDDLVPVEVEEDDDAGAAGNADAGVAASAAGAAAVTAVTSRTSAPASNLISGSGAAVSAAAAGSSPGPSITGYVSKMHTGIGRVTEGRQFTYINGRPVDIPR